MPRATPIARAVFVVAAITAGVGPALGLLAIEQQAEDEWLAHPVDDATFRGYLEFFAYDADLPLDVQVADFEVVDGIRRERLSFQSTPGLRVTAVFVRAENAPETGQPAVILTDGGGPQGKDGAGTQLYAELLARAGWAVLAIDLWHYGERDDGLLGTFSQEERNGRLYSNHSNYLEFMIQSVKDVGRAIDYLVAERRVDADRIVYVGYSRGAVVGSIAGGAENRLAGVALLFPGHRLSWASSHVAAACPANYVSRISPRPLLMINGTEDTFFPMESTVLPLQRLAGEPRVFRWFDLPHGSLATEEVQAALMSWLAETFPQR